MVLTGSFQTIPNVSSTEEIGHLIITIIRNKLLSPTPLDGRNLSGGGGGVNLFWDDTLYKRSPYNMRQREFLYFRIRIIFNTLTAENFSQ